MANKSFEVKIISESFIRPKCEVEQSKYPYYLSPSDLNVLPLSYIQKGLLYIKPSDARLSTSNIESLVENLRHSLSIALVHFYPLAGRLVTIKYEHEDACLIYVDCSSNTSPGARFIHATVQEEVTVSDILSSKVRTPQHFSSFFEAGEGSLVNHDGHSKALLSVQVTDLIDGVFLGFTMNHSLGDGTSFWYFINTLSHIFLRLADSCKLKSELNQMVQPIIGEENDDIILHKPILNHVILDGYGPVYKLPYLNPHEFIRHHDVDPGLRLRVFHFSASSIARLKTEVNTGNKDNGSTISSFQALSAFVWRSINRARNLPFETVMPCWLAADIRSRLEPKLSPNHFGNFAQFAQAYATARELQVNGLGWAATLLHQAVAGLNDKAIRAALKASARSPQVAKLRASSGNVLLFVESMRTDSYGPEFGLGKAVAIPPGTATWMDGRIAVLPGREGLGSTDLEICLSLETMAALESDEEFLAFAS